MKVPFVDFHITDEQMRGEIDSAYRDLITRAAFIGGEPVEKFAQEFAAFCGGGTCVPVANGTDALILALRALGIGAGDEVITVPYTFIASAEAISMVGATPKFVDIHPKSYTMDVNLLERAISPKTKAILPVHLYGQSADMDPIMEIAHKHNLKVIEDACQAHGAEYKKKRVGTLGDAGCFSFYPTKNLGGFGDGGAVTTRSEELAKKVTQLANHGRSAQYFHDVVGLNSRMDSLQAAALRIKLKKLNKWNERRRQLAGIYFAELKDNTYLTLPAIEAHALHVFHLFCIESPHRDALERHLKSEGIGCGVYYPLSVHLQPAYAHLKHKKGDFPAAERASERILALPMFAEMSDQQIEAVVAAVKRFVPS